MLEKTYTEVSLPANKLLTGGSDAKIYFYQRNYIVKN